MADAGRRHGRHGNQLPGHRPVARHHAPLPGGGNQPAWRGRVVGCGGRDDEPRAGTADAPDGDGEGDLEDRAGLDGAVFGPDHGLPDRGVSNRHQPVDGAGDRHRVQVTEYTHTGLDPGTRRYYRVAAINAAGRGTWSSVANATTDATAPGAPTGLRAVPSGLGGRTQLLLTWTRPSSDGGGAITGYRIEVSANRISWTTLEANTGTAGTSYTHGGLEPATTRYYRVAAINAEGTGPYSNVATGRTNAGAPDAPGSLRARADGPRSITLTWEVPSEDNGARITGYRIRARLAEETTWTTIRGNTNSTATTFTHTRLEPATAWRYQVAAINSVGVGPVVAGGGHGHQPRRALGADRPDGPGGGNVTDRPRVARTVEHRRREGSGLPGRGVERRRQDLADHPQQHGLEGRVLLAPQPAARDDVALSRVRDQRGGARSRFRCRAGDDRGDPAGRAAELDGRRGRHLGDRSVVAAPVVGRRRGGHGLPGRGVGQRRCQLADAGGQHALVRDLLLTHRARARDHATLPGLGDQPGRGRKRIGRRERDDGRHRARPAHRPDRHRDLADADRPGLDRARLRRRRIGHRLPDRGLGDRTELGHPGVRHAGDGHDLCSHGPAAGQPAVLPRLGDQPRGRG